MLKDLFPRVHPRYSSLPVLGLILADYARWLFAAGYPRHRVLMHLRSAVRLDAIELPALSGRILLLQP